MPSVGSGSRVPPGGTADQILRKKSTTDFDLKWDDPGSLVGAQGPKGDTGAAGAAGAQGVKGDTGAAGAAGATGPAGPGVPTGGTSGQVLTKNSGTDYDTKWAAPASSSGGGALNPTTVKTANYTAVANDLVLCNPGVNNIPITVTLPASPTAGTVVSVKKVDLTGAVVFVVAPDGSSLDVHTSYPLNYQGQSVTVQWSGSYWIITSASMSIESAGQFTPYYQDSYWFDRRIGSPTPGAALTSSGGLAVSRNYWFPHYNQREVSINACGVLTGSSAPTGGSTLAIGIYRNSSSIGGPGTIISNFGTLTGASYGATSLATLSFSSVLLPKGWFWWGMATNGTSFGSLMSLLASQIAMPQTGMPQGSFSTVTAQYAMTPLYYQATGGTGSLPSTGGGAALYSNPATVYVPNIYWKTTIAGTNL